MREQLRSLARGVAEQVSLRLLAAGELIDVDPETALAHATVARRLASRIPAVREATGLAAYHAGQWQTAIAELRTYHRISGRLSHLAVLADCERALGRPERAVDIFRAADRSQLGEAEAVELLIVAAGARADLGQREAAVAMLQVPQLAGDQPWAARLRYAYADALLGLGRAAEAREWFARAAEIDHEAMTDAAERLLELDGVVLDEDEDEIGDEDEGMTGAEGHAPAGERGYSVDGANSDTQVDSAGSAGDPTMSDVEDAVAYDDDDLADLDEDEDADDEFDDLDEDDLDDEDDDDDLDDEDDDDDLDDEDDDDDLDDDDLDDDDLDDEDESDDEDFDGDDLDDGEDDDSADDDLADDEDGGGQGPP